ncbi:MAG: glycosyltransferase family 2 protein [Luteolibacter sp.]
MSKNSVKLSVIMPVWNGEAYLREAVDSILNQSFRDFEFLILDDGSTDSTPKILEEYASKDSRIRIIPLDHEGIVIALNRGVAESKAEWVARMDCDDIAHPSRLEKQWKALERNNNAVLCHTQIQLMSDDDYAGKASRFIRSEAMTILRLCYQCPIVHPTVIYKKSTFIAAGGYLPEERHAEDFGLWGRLLQHGSIVGIADPLLKLRIHQGSISKQKAETQMALSFDIAMRHCGKFMRLNESESRRALEALRYYTTSSTIRDWLWLATYAIPRLEKHSFELGIWLIRATARRLIRSK